MFRKYFNLYLHLFTFNHISFILNVLFPILIITMYHTCNNFFCDRKKYFLFLKYNFLLYYYYCINQCIMQLLAPHFIGMQIFWARHDSKRNIAPSSEVHLHSQVFEAGTTILVSFIAVIHCFDRRGNSERPNHLFANLEKLAKTLLSAWYTVIRRTCFSSDSSGFRVSRASLQSSYS